ncbi:peptidoglycan DD-metalloendopeptidase family protein [Fibrella aquatilis]|uniref:Peptidoglycan DD-metalloendopeptidase family protein n=1 Tax=Fibrella aquatilis TaxID=2817059 RepID=A0A939GA24_9BACT|nr:peptidoglycan DD-metalloendopeptidase family protein [Fibrella aquatilis]MBO0933075.1 peptidoglycan DD-metalloendopeptidase family protein [Fibrella aquatilis]
MKSTLSFLSLLMLVAACTGSGPGSGLFHTPSPHERYEQSLKTADLDRTALGLAWANAAQRALRDSLTISVPYRESGYFSAAQPLAVGYRMAGVRGDKFTIRVNVQGREPVRVFVDVFSIDGGKVAPIAAAKTDTTNAPTELVWEPRRNQTYLIRVQPELLRSGHYTIAITREPVLLFPVQGRSSKQISSYFGVPRDGGRRRHEGIDIFAPKGTPALASVAGVVSQVGQNQLGGNVVFLTDADREQRLYYAHLDRFNVTTGQRVNPGDTVGFVGNTGNARTTGPHLHFGVYTYADGAVDPLPYVRLGRGPAQQELLNSALLGDSARVSAGKVSLRLSPSTDAPVVRELPRQQPLTILGGTANWLRVSLPTGQPGYVARDAVEALAKPLRTDQLTTPAALLDEAHPRAAVIQTLPAGSSVAVLGQIPNFWFIKTTAGQTGWLLRQGVK